MHRLISDRVGKKWYNPDKWDNEETLIIGDFLFSNVMVFPDRVIKEVQKIGDEYRSNTHYAKYTEKGVEIGHQWHDDEQMIVPYEKFIQLLEKWRIFLDTDDDPEKFIIAMDDEYNFTFEYVLNSEKKVI